MTDNNGQPYRGIAAELVADAISMMQMVGRRRPEITQLPGMLYVAVDWRAGTILVGLLQQDGSLVLVERILADPQQPATFGASELPISVDERQTH